MPKSVKDLGARPLQDLLAKASSQELVRRKLVQELVAKTCFESMAKACLGVSD